ncbi:MAG: hypothetical protein EBU84_21905 [Actinobacteria bacterium]|nr:hypothetical protein [Actinomycetota bacterium]
MLKFYLSQGAAMLGLNSDELGLMAQVIMARIEGTNNTEFSGSVGVAGGEPLLYKVASFDSTGLFSMPFRTSSNLKVSVWQESETPNNFDQVFSIRIG